MRRRGDSSFRRSDYFYTQHTTYLFMSTTVDRLTLEEKLMGALRSRVSEDSFARWFKGMTVSRVDETEIVLNVGDFIHQMWIEENFADLLQDVVLMVANEPLRVRITAEEDVVAEATLVSAGSMGKGKLPKLAEEKNSGARPKVPTRRAHCLNPLFLFDNFVVGPNSEFAYAGAKAVAQSPSAMYNPLFIHGGSGLGKTHLMHAIGNEAVGRLGADAVLYITCEQFTNEFIDAIQSKQLTKFRRKYRKVELLLLDDVQFFGGKERSQEEFFHTFSELLNGHRQVVLTSDRPACEISKLEPRLVSRFENGLTVEMEAPSLETRVAILRQKRQDLNVSVDDSILDFLAERIRKNVRRLEGALMRIATFASLSREVMTFDRVEHLLRDILREESQRAVTVDLVQRQVAEHFDVRLVDMTSRRRPANIAHARQVAMFLSRQMTKLSLMEIGEAFGGRDHGTVIHAVKSIEAKIKTDLVLRDTVERIDALLR